MQHARHSKESHDSSSSGTPCPAVEIRIPGSLLPFEKFCASLAEGGVLLCGECSVCEVARCNPADERSVWAT
jgi:hypothetical protein